MSAPPTTIIVTCSCGAKLKVSSASVGKKAKCPKCQSIVTIAAPRDSGVSASLPNTPPSGGSDLLGHLAEHEQQAAATPLPPAGAACPHCGLPVAVNVRVCTACGFDLKKGRLLTTATASGSAAKEKAAALVKSAGTFMLGTVLSLVGALLGGAVWFLVAWYLNAEVGYVAWGIGFVAGVGMLIGCKDPSAKAGIVAALMSVVGIVAAKAAIFFVIIYIVVTGNTSNIDSQRGFVTVQMAEEILDDKGVSDDAEREKQWESTYAEAEGRVKKMSDEEVRRQWAAYREAIAQARTERSPDEPETGGGAGILKAFVATQFGLFDLLWFILALGTAYKIGNTGLQKQEE